MHGLATPGEYASERSSAVVKGFVGRIELAMTVRDSYATGNVVSGGYGAGGFVGYQIEDAGNLINRSYATGTVRGGVTGIGGFAGFAGGA